MDKKRSLKIQIPTQAWASIFAIMDIDNTLNQKPNITLEEYIKQQKKKTNIWGINNPEMPIFNIGTVAMMSYAFLVLPKEVINYNEFTDEDQNKMNSILKKIDVRTNNLIKKFSVEENIIRHIRNSVAHVNYELNPELETIVFKDFETYKKENLTFEGEIRIEIYINLIQEYFKIFYRTYLESLI